MPGTLDFYANLSCSFCPVSQRFLELVSQYCMLDENVFQFPTSNQLKYVNWFQGVSGRDEPLQGRVQGELLSKRMARLQEQGH